MTTTTNPLHKSLTSLLPGSTIPPRLLSATESLLSISRQRATNLKPDEEIARSHACAEIACKKLRVALRLSNVKSGAGAPCRPTVYKKLLTFLENTLADVDLVGTPGGRKKNGVSATGEVKTPVRTPTTAKRKRDAEAEAQAAADAEVLSREDTQIDTPSKKRRTTGSTPKTRTPIHKTNDFTGRIEASARKKSTSTQDDEAPTHVLPSVRKLCKTFTTPQMVPHVYTGVCIILSLAGRWSRPPNNTNGTTTSIINEEDPSSTFNQDISASIIAIYLLTLTKMQQGPMTTEIYNTVLNRGIAVLDLNTSPSQSETEAETETEILDIEQQIEEWIALIQEQRWTTDDGKGSDWWESIPEDILPPLSLSLDSDSIGQSSDVEVDDADEHDVEDTGSPTPKPRRTHPNNIINTTATSIPSRREELKRTLERSDPEDVLLPGLGTMMNDAVDFLSEERMEEFLRWKVGILRRVEGIEKRGGAERSGKGRGSGGGGGQGKGRERGGGVAVVV